MRAEFAIPERLEAVPVPPAVAELPVPGFVDAFIRDAEDRAEALDEQAGNGQFVPGDARHAFQVLQWLRWENGLPAGARFLEWGCGQGVVAILAAAQGCQARGVEIDAALVDEARALSRRYDIPAEFIHGSYDPAVPRMKVVTAKDSDVVYVYPWPGDEAAVLQLFAGDAAEGAWLLMCLGPEDIRAYRRKKD